MVSVNKIRLLLDPVMQGIFTSLNDVLKSLYFD